MIRFRLRRDEERYYDILGDIRRFECRPSSSAEMGILLRQRAKAEEMIFLEGMRQGVAAAAIAVLIRDAGGPDFTTLKSYQLHSMVYGSADTPLRDAELSLMKRYGIDVSEQATAFLDEKAMLFAPETVHEGSKFIFDESLDVDDDDVSLFDVMEREEPADDPKEETPPPGQRTFMGRPLYHESDFDDEHPIHSPEIVERIRGHVQGSASTWGSWEEMVMDLAGRSHIGAPLVDMVLNTPVGRTMLTQHGVHLQPGHAFHVPTPVPTEG